MPHYMDDYARELLAQQERERAAERDREQRNLAELWKEIEEEDAAAEAEAQAEGGPRDELQSRVEQIERERAAERGVPDANTFPTWEQYHREDVKRLLRAQRAAEELEKREHAERRLSIVGRAA